MSHQQWPSQFHWDCLTGNKLNQMDLSPLYPSNQQTLQWRTGRTTRYHPTDQVISLPWSPWYPSGLWLQVKSLLSGMVSAKMCQVYHLCHLTVGWPMGPYWVCQRLIPITNTNQFLLANTLKSNLDSLLLIVLYQANIMVIANTTIKSNLDSCYDHPSVLYHHQAQMTISHDHQTSTVDSYDVHQSTINQFNHHSSYYGPPSTIMNNHD